MRFSVLIPVYNVEKYIEKCLNSVLRQTYQDFEVILVDDGSTDLSGQICDEYKEHYPTKVKVIHKKNQGLISARRVGIKAAYGEFCVFVDSDDFVESDLLEIIDSYLNKDSETDVLLYSFAYYRNDEKSNRFKSVAKDGHIWTGETKKEIYEKISCSSDITSIWTKAIRTSILQEDFTDYSTYYDKNMAEDLLQSLYPLTAARKIMYTEKALYNYRINDKSISRNFRTETLNKKDTIHVHDKVLEYLEIWGMNSQEMRQRVDAKWFNEAMYMISKSYESTHTKEEKKAVIGYDWNRLIPGGVFSSDNAYENQDYQKLYSMWLVGNEKGIHRYFWKKRCYQKAKEIKRKLLR